MPTAVALRHLAFEDLGLIEPWLARRNWRVRYCDAGVDDPGIVGAGADLLVVLGGPIGAEEDDLYPFLRDEVELIRRRLDIGAPTLGICLGAQLMARALGARVRPMPRKEIGFAALSLSPEGVLSPLVHVGTQPVLHWHGDQFELPLGVRSLASTSLCANQAFMPGEHAMAWQFHLEVNTTCFEKWLIGHTGELRQTAADIPALRARARASRHRMAPVLDAVLADWFSRLGLP